MLYMGVAKGYCLGPIGSMQERRDGGMKGFPSWHRVRNKRIPGMNQSWMAVPYPRRGISGVVGSDLIHSDLRCLWHRHICKGIA